MGWRAALRSAGAASRRTAREQQRVSNQIARLHSKADRLLGKLSDEARTDAQKVERFEEGIYRCPVKTLAIRCDLAGVWTCEPLRDRSGSIQFTIAPEFRSDPVSFNPEIVCFEGRAFKGIACCISQYATLLAFGVVVHPSTPGSASRRLVNKTTPENSVLAIVADGQVYYAFDADIDGQNIPGVPTVRVVAFEPLSTPVNSFSIAFIPKATKSQPDPDALWMQVAGPTIASEVQSLPTAESLVEQFERTLSIEIGRVSHEIRSSLPKRTSGSGCGIVLFLTVALICATALFAVAG